MDNNIIIKDANKYTYKSAGIYRSLQKLMRQVHDSTQKVSKIDREVFIKELQKNIIEAMVLVMKAYHLKDNKYDLLIKTGDKLNLIEMYIDSLLTIRAIKEDQYNNLRTIFENTINHYTRWINSVRIKIGYVDTEEI